MVIMKLSNYLCCLIEQAVAGEKNIEQVQQY